MTAPGALFDLAINRAATTLSGLGQQAGSQSAAAALGEWHARTRFARRVPLVQVQRCLELRPDRGEWHWEGGPEGGWVVGRATFP